MSSVQSRRTAVHDVLFNRPYLRADLIRLAAYLCEEGYSTMAHNRVIDAVADGTSLEELVQRDELEPADLEPARHYLAIGQQINARRPTRRIESISDLAVLLTTALRSAGIEPRLAGTALAVTIGGRAVQIALIGPVSGGAPAGIAPVPPELTEDEEIELLDAWDRQASEEYGHYLDSLTDEQIDALAAGGAGARRRRADPRGPRHQADLRRCPTPVRRRLDRRR